MNIENDAKLDYCDVLLVPQRSKLPSRSHVCLERTYSFPHCPHQLNCVGVIAANMDTVGTFDMAKEFYKHKMLVALHKHYSVDELHDFFKDKKYWSTAFVTVGTSIQDEEKLDALTTRVLNDNPNEIFPRLLCIDIANGYSEHFTDKLKSYRKKYPDTIIMAGNVCTSNMAEELIMSGADIAKIGIGPGSVCTTRVKTGVGYPQLSASSECSYAAHGLRGQVCADGGITCAGDMSKAFAVGADFVMVGSMIAGTDECEGEFVYEYSKNIPYETLPKLLLLYDLFKDSDLDYNSPESRYLYSWKYKYEHVLDLDVQGFLYHHGLDSGCLVKDFIGAIEDNVIVKKFKYYGMSSFQAQEKHTGEIKSHRTAEGKVVTIDAKGPVENIIQDILGGVRSTCTYVGAQKIKDLPKCAKFVKVNRTHNTVYGDNWKKS